MSATRNQLTVDEKKAIINMYHYGQHPICSLHSNLKDKGTIRYVIKLNDETVSKDSGLSRLLLRPTGEHKL
jgi:hypothetical protein